MAFVVLGRTQTADATPYDNSITQFTAPCDDVQTAIERLKAYTETVARFCIPCGFDGNATTGRWFEFITNVGSDATPFVLPKNAKLQELTLVVQTSTTTSVRVFRNGANLTTISLSAQRKNSLTNLNLSLNANDEISVQTISGSSSKPMLYMFYVFT